MLAEVIESDASLRRAECLVKAFTELPTLDEVTTRKVKYTNFRLNNVGTVVPCNIAIVLLLAVQVVSADHLSNFSNNGSLVRITRANFERIDCKSQAAFLQDTINRLNDEIKGLQKSDSASANNYAELISDLNEQIVKLISSSDNLKKYSEQELSQKNSLIRTLRVSIEDLNIQISNLKIKIQKSEQDDLPNDCVRDIEAKRFKDANKKLELIGKDKISYVVAKAYMCRATNLILLLDFADKIEKIELKMSFYNAVERELELTKNHNNLLVTELCVAVKRSIINGNGTPDNVKQEAVRLVERLHILIKQNLIGAMETANYDPSKRVGFYEIVDKIFTFDVLWFRRMIEDIFYIKYDKKDEALKYLMAHTWIPELVQSRVAAFNVLKQKNDLKSHTALLLAMYINEFLSHYSYYLKSNPTYEVMLKSIKTEWPSDSLSALAFAPKLYIKNIKYNEYLFASDPGDIVDESDRRRVYTLVSGDRGSLAYWQVVCNTNNFQCTIKNTINDEYLFASFMHQKGAGHNSHRVFTWIPKNEVIQGNWELLLDTNTGYMAIKNVLCGGYLVIVRVLFYNNQRNSVTLPQSAKCQIMPFSWKFED